MGFVVHSASLLSLALRAATDHADTSDPLFRALQSFRLIAFVLHDPREHRDLDEVLRSRFVSLDRDTGAHLLFFTLADVERSPAYERRRHARSLSLAFEQAVSPAELVHRFVERTGLDYVVPGATRWNDERKAIDAFLAELGVLGRELPCIVVVDRAHPDAAWSVRTSPGRVEPQLVALGAMAKALAEADRHGALASRGLTAEGFEWRGFPPNEVRRLALDVPFLEATTQALALSGGWSDSPNLRGLPRPDALARRRRHDYEALCERLANPDGDLTESALDRAALRLIRATVFAMERRPTREASRILQAIDGLVEREVAVDLTAAVLALHLEPDDVTAPWVAHGIRGMTVSFEAELVLSIMQWMRGCRGIELPAYFCRYQDRVVAREGDVDFNQKRQGEWLPPGMGQALQVIQRFGGAPAPWSHDVQAWEAFRRRWAEIGPLRNRYAHGRFDRRSHDTRLDASRCLQIFEELAGAGDFGRMYDLKKRCGRDAWRESQRDVDDREMQRILLATWRNEQAQRADDERRELETIERREREELEAIERRRREARVAMAVDSVAICARREPLDAQALVDALRHARDLGVAPSTLREPLASAVAHGSAALEAWCRSASEPQDWALYCAYFKGIMAQPAEAWCVRDQVERAAYNVHVRTRLGQKRKYKSHRLHCDEALLARLFEADASRPAPVLVELRGNDVHLVAGRAPAT
jgi:hypothetical protein